MINKIFLLIILLNVTSYSNIFGSKINSVLNESCLQPIETFAYQTNLEKGSKRNQSNTPPSFPWVIAADLPAIPDNTHSYDMFLAARKRESYNEIWVRRNINFLGEQSNLPSYFEILIYRDDQKSWKEFKQYIDESLLSPGNMYVDISGNFWTINYQALQGSPKLLLFDNQLELFQEVSGSEILPEGKMIFDPQGTIWVISSGDSIYSFDLKSHKLTKRITISDKNISYDSFRNSAVLLSNGDLYFLSDLSQTSYSGNVELFRFTPKTNQINKIQIQLSPYLPIGGIFADHSDNLWFSDLGWMQADGSWYEIFRSPVFLTKNAPDSRYQYLYETPQILAESSDNRIWYRSSNGIISLDTKDKQWCWVTNIQEADIINDERNKLWMIANGKLYFHS